MNVEWVITGQPLDVVGHPFNPCMTGVFCILIIHRVADADGEGRCKIHHPLVKESPDVSREAFDHHRDLGFPGPVTLGFDDPQECGGTWEVQCVNVT